MSTKHDNLLIWFILHYGKSYRSPVTSKSRHIVFVSDFKVKDPNHILGLHEDDKITQLGPNELLNTVNVTKLNNDFFITGPKSLFMSSW